MDGIRKDQAFAVQISHFRFSRDLGMEGIRRNRAFAVEISQLSCGSVVRLKENIRRPTYCPTEDQGHNARTTKLFQGFTKEAKDEEVLPIFEYGISHPGACMCGAHVPGSPLERRFGDNQPQLYHQSDWANDFRYRLHETKRGLEYLNRNILQHGLWGLPQRPCPAALKTYHVVWNLNDWNSDYRGRITQ
jgi:hypothetical protein